MKNNQTSAVVRTASFSESPLTIVNYDGRRWLTASQIGQALEMADPANSVNRIFQRNKDEFSEGADSTSVKLTALDGRQRETRVFSETGCILLAFLSKSQKAKDFRRWAKQELANPTRPQTDRSSNREQELLNELRPELGKIAHYHGLGLNLSEIGRLMDKKPGSIVHALNRLSKLGLLPQPGSQLSLQSA
ncbi:Bro-N domain-containing protein [uncultured Endozoicomonas sp.]|uniref:BRO-N domain-containing protein n=1 Tax=uncultured Endozoicomonas sp. TaxID=432652 RepID=UPI00261D3E18|nr:Bro-N domain-containing protein [uncultured Endozoicomonas sp.]